jgi:hypothetical protein
MNKFVHVVTDSSVMVLDTETGEQVKFFAGDTRYETAIAFLKDGEPESVFELDTKHVITNFFSYENSDDMGDVSIVIEDGEGWVVLHNYSDMKVELQSAITKRIIKMSEQGFDSQPLVNFISNLYGNPSKTAVDELYLFIEANELPITEDGHFIAYKIVKNDYKDIYSNSMDNSIGSVVSMPRHLVDTERNNTCSRGLHFCSKDYLSHYGSSNRSNDRCLLVKINPADVVSIPSDYNNAKGRTWSYEVVGEVESGWRETLPTVDYTQDAVVSSTGTKVEAQPEPVEVVVPTESLDEKYATGYECGWVDAKDGTPFFPAEDYENMIDADKEFNRGYDQGYKDKKNHKAKKVQF